VIDRDVVARKLLSLGEALRELERPEARDPRALASNAMLRAAVERWLHVALEACTYVAFHVVASEGWTPPESGRAAFESLAAHGKLDLELARRLGSAAGLRNLLVHDYASVDLARLASIVASDLGDLRTFAALAASWM
jgi:uncharacterized protein YutE (UPF0331/DUF86 family)